ncbi:hypothetical protein FRB99_002801 [Tulasnella sp. 403]|nr:hypothetical protein FRB99_002801 [Tulasnella sp. 403]
MSVDPSKEIPRAVCVYCASSPGIQPEYRDAATSLGNALASSSRPLVYGGGNRGLMGIVSSSVLTNGGNAIGVLPRAMVNAGGEGRGKVEGGPKQPLDAVNSANMQSIVVESMHERKTTMARLAGDGFIALPGGFGTFEEVLEAITWSQLGIHQKPVVLLNVNGYWDPLKQLIEKGVGESFIEPKNRSLVTSIDAPSTGSAGFDWGKAALEAIEAWTPPQDGGYFNWGTNKLGST